MVAVGSTQPPARNLTMTVCYSYRRISSERQTTKGDSLRRQTEHTVKLCEQNGWVLDQSFRLQDLGVSGWKGNNVRNGALGAFVEAVRQKRIPQGSVLCVESVDRLGRDQVAEALKLFLEILGHGVNIQTLTPERLYTNANINDIACLIEPLVYMSRAWEESETKSIRIKAKWSHKRQEVRDGKRKVIGKREPFWVEVVEGEFKLIPENVALVRRMFALCLEGYGFATVAKTINAEGSRTPRKGQPWNATLVSKIVKGKAVLGHYQPGVWVDGKEIPDGPEITDYYPKVIDEATYYRAIQAVAARNKQGRGRREKNTRNIFTGLIFNGNDGLPLYYFRHIQGQWQSRKLVSKGVYNRNTSDCDKTVIYYDSFEDAFLSRVHEVDASDFLDSNIGDTASRIAEINGRLVELDQTIATTKKRIKDSKGKTSAVEQYLDVLADLGNEQEALRDELERLRALESSHAVDTLGAVQNLAARLRDATEDEATEIRTRLRQYLKTVVERITVYPHVVGRGSRMKLLYELVVGVKFHGHGTEGQGIKLFYRIDQDGRGLPLRDDSGKVPKWVENAQKDFRSLVGDGWERYVRWDREEE